MREKKSLFAGDSLFLTSILVISLIVIGFIFFSDRQSKDKNTNEQEVQTRTIFALDTYIEVKLYGKDKKELKNLLDEAEGYYEEFHQLTDRYNPYGDLKNIYYVNTHPNEEVVLDERLYKLLKFSMDLYEQTNHKLNVGMGAVLEVWHDHREACEAEVDPVCTVPTKSELETANQFTDITKIQLNDKNHSVKIPTGYSIDLGSTAKGYITELVGELFEENNHPYYLINAGGNIKVGKHPEGRLWNIGLQDPRNPEKLYGTVKIENASAVTSGDYQRFFVVDDVEYHHIIDPDTLFPANFGHSITIVTKDSALADGIDTALFQMTPEDAIAYVDKLDGVEAVYYDYNDHLHFSKNFKDKYLGDLNENLK